MTIILFLVDTSSSMNQRTYLGTSLIDIAKASVETFMKVNSMSKSICFALYNCKLYFQWLIRVYFVLQIRSRDTNSRWDRYMLLTFEDPPANIKVNNE